MIEFEGKDDEDFVESTGGFSVAVVATVGDSLSAAVFKCLHGGSGTGKLASHVHPMVVRFRRGLMRNHGQ